MDYCNAWQLIIHQRQSQSQINEQKGEQLDQLLPFLFRYEPGTELFCRGATPRVSSPQKRFTTEFGMGSEWDRNAKSTRKELSRLHSNKNEKVGQALGLLVRLGCNHY